MVAQMTRMRASGGSCNDSGHLSTTAAAASSSASSSRRRPPLPHLDVASFTAFFSLPANPPSSATPASCTTTSPAFPSPWNATAAPFPSPSCAAAAPSPIRSPMEATPSSPLTIFYNGTVSVYDLPHDSADTIMRWAVAAASTPPASPAAAMNVGTPTHGSGGGQLQQQKPVDLLKAGDLPIAKRKSLERFLQRRKER